MPILCRELTQILRFDIACIGQTKLLNAQAKLCMHPGWMLWQIWVLEARKIHTGSVTPDGRFVADFRVTAVPQMKVRILS